MKVSQQFRSRISVFLGFGLPFFLLVFWDTFLTWVMVVRYEMNDFAKFYYSTVAFLNDGDMYGPSFVTFGQIGSNFAQHLWNLNPPHFHLLILPLGILSPALALTIWGLTSFAAFLLGLHWIAQELRLHPTPWQRRLIVLGILAFSGTGGLLLTGQLSLLLFLPVTLAWIHMRQGKWEKAGLSIGLAASIKPFLFIFLPYLLLKRQFKAAGVVLILTITNFAIGLIVFGVQAHTDWIQRLASVDFAWLFMNTSILGMITRTFTDNPMYSVMINAEEVLTYVWVTLSAFLGITALFITTNDTSRLSIDRTFALLLITAFLISPLGWIYYFFLPLGPVTGLVTTWWTQPNPKIFLTLQHKQGLRNIAVLIATVGFLVPPEVTLLFQPNSFATFTIGSVFFWCTSLLWFSLFIDWRLENPRIEWSTFRTRRTPMANFQSMAPTSVSQRSSHSAPHMLF